MPSNLHVKFRICCGKRFHGVCAYLGAWIPSKQASRGAHRAKVRKYEVHTYQGAVARGKFKPIVTRLTGHT